MILRSENPDLSAGEMGKGGGGGGRNITYTPSYPSPYFDGQNYHKKWKPDLSAGETGKGGGGVDGTLRTPSYPSPYFGGINPFQDKFREYKLELRTVNL